MNLPELLSAFQDCCSLSREQFAAALGLTSEELTALEAGNTSVFSADGFLQPDYSALDEWESFSQYILLEYRQLKEEGVAAEHFEALFQAIAELEAGALKERLSDILFRATRDLPSHLAYPFQEPSDYASICTLADRDGFCGAFPSKEVLRKKLQGGWYGRICGCLNGKAVEGYLSGELEPLLKKSGNYPMHRYILRCETAQLMQELNMPLPRSLADDNPFAPADDDTNYPVLAQRLIETCGRDFQPLDVARLWISSQPKSTYCTAERVAFLNVCRGYLPPASAAYKNVFREYLGAQIRGDYFGYINPCDAASAAEMAWRDASISHIKNGIYGEMFVAAMVSAAFGTSDLEQIVRTGLSVIPRTSRLHHRIRYVISLWKDCWTLEQILADIHSQYVESDPFDWGHTISNAMFVTAILLAGGGDYSKCICMAVQNGYDTDCNAATVGSILGVRNGIDGIPEQWTAPIHGRLAVGICGTAELSVDQLVETTMTHIVFPANCP